MKWAGQSLLLAMAALIALGLLNGAPGSVEAQGQKSAAAASAYEFDVATIKPAPPGSNGGVAGYLSDDTFRARNYSLGQVIRMAYGKTWGPKEQLAGGPSWLDSERYDVTAKMDSSVADALKKLRPDERTQAQERMLQALFADRLKLEVHREVKELPVYFLTIAKNGPKLTEAKPGDPDPKAFPYADKFAGGAKSGGLYGVVGGSPGAMTETVYCLGVSTFALVRQLAFHTGRVVLDRTGLTGSYDFTLKFAMGPGRRTSEDGTDGVVPTASDPSGVPDLFAAIQQQLGLKLVSGKGPVETIVIDHVERPSGN
ncbi:MAG TPA: TIGR03435 family protein [Candidatus Acidoferrales bacterium]|nr:TIGR03435 family protein [Candidatus Acidoferrales bacterium]